MFGNIWIFEYAALQLGLPQHMVRKPFKGNHLNTFAFFVFVKYLLVTLPYPLYLYRNGAIENSIADANAEVICNNKLFSLWLLR